jgi:protein-S-isoprenylcysteine O-methyltransferase Ste14
MRTEIGVNAAIVFGSAVVYWTGVWIQARRIRRRTGRSSNTRPHGTKERLLWAGWFLVVASWLALPFLAVGHPASAGLTLVPGLVHPFGRVLGIVIMGAGYLGTLWCYAAMGNAWRMGINRAEKTELVRRGPYGFVRHPIYLFQVMMVAAIAFLLPSVLACLILAIHIVCVRIKAADEEAHLRTLLGEPYQAYCARTGAWLPRLRKRDSVAELPADRRDSLNHAEQPVK